MDSRATDGPAAVRAEIAGETARLGAMLAIKGLTPDQVATVVRDQVQPLLDDAIGRTERGEDISQLQVGQRYRS
jgi:hypothetical protein